MRMWEDRAHCQDGHLRCTGAATSSGEEGTIVDVQLVGGAPNGIEEMQAVCRSRLGRFTLHQIGEVLWQES